MHRAETILDTIEAILGNLNTTKNRVERDRVHPPVTTPALSVEFGEENPVSETNFHFQDCELEVLIQIHVKRDNFNTYVNQIKSEVYSALMEDHTLGLPFVHRIRWDGDRRPESSGDSETKTNKTQMRFVVFYRHSYKSKEA